MIEKLAEMVREQSSGVPCYMCHVLGYNCKDNLCPTEKEAPFMVARYAVLLVARALPSWEEYDEARGGYQAAMNAWQEARDAGARMDTIIAVKGKAFAKCAELHVIVMDELTRLICEASEGGE